jgi:hypothetical protein
LHELEKEYFKMYEEFARIAREEHDEATLKLMTEFVEI